MEGSNLRISSDSNSVILDRIVEIDRLRIHYLEKPGESHHPPLILLHGFASGGYIWKGLMRMLSVPNRILALDLPGNGSSMLSRENPTLDYHLRFLDAFRSALSIDTLFAVGHSMGGSITAAYASRYKDRILGFILENPADDRSKVSPLMKFISLPVIGELMMQFYPPSRGALRRRLERGLYDPSCLPADVVEGSWNAFTRGSLRKWIPRALRVPKTPIAWESITTPCTIIYGTADYLTPSFFIERLKSLMPQASFRPFENCRHVPHLESREKFQRVVEEMLESKGAQASSLH